MTIDQLLARLSGVRNTSNGFEAQCPGHDDSTASLCIHQEPDGKILMHCQAGCNTRAVLSAIGLTVNDLFPAERFRVEDDGAHGKKIEATYDYVDLSGKLRFQVVRMRKGGRKTFRQRRPDPNNPNQWIWDTKGITKILYCLPDVVRAREAGETIYIPEGEKDCQTLQNMGLTATTNAEGSKAKWLKSYTRELANCDIVLLPDNDTPGREHTQEIIRNLFGQAARIRVLALPGLPENGDITDWIVEQNHTKDEFLSLVESAAEEITEISNDILTPTDAHYMLTDLGNSERLVDTSDNSFRYNVDSSQWLVWTGSRWQEDFTGVVHRLARVVVRSMYDDLKDAKSSEERDALYAHVKKSESAPRLAAMVELAKYHQNVPVRELTLDSDPWALNCLNGTLDLRTCTLRPHKPTDFLTKIIPVKYDPAAQCPRWLQFLSEVFRDDNDLIAFTQRMCGYLLTGDVREQAFFLLVGKGSNGKGVFTETLQHILGDYAKDTPVTTFLEKREASTSDLAALVGARLVTASEGEDTTSFNEGLLKRLSGGDRITCRHLYQNFFTYQPAFKILFSTNEVPKIRSQNYAMKRRVKVLPFRVKFYYEYERKVPVRDESLKTKLQSEFSGILNWMLEGCRQWQKYGLGMPPVMIQEVESLFESMDPLSEFLESECVFHPGAAVESGVLWKTYVGWCRFLNREPAFRLTHHFTRSIVQRDGVEAGRNFAGTKRILKGIGLVEKYRDYMEIQPENFQTNFQENLPDFQDEVQELFSKPILSSDATDAKRDISVKYPETLYSKEKVSADADLASVASENDENVQDNDGKLILNGNKKIEITEKLASAGSNGKDNGNGSGNSNDDHSSDTSNGSGNDNFSGIIDLHNLPPGTEVF